MKINTVAVAGATGVQGGALARLLLDRGVPVRALTRDPARAAATALRARGAQVVRADFDDADSLDRALRGARSLFLMSTPFGTDPATETRQGRAAVDAAARGGVEHVVFSSVAHADRGTGVPHFDSKHRIEEHLAASGLDWTVLGPAKFMDNYRAERVLAGLRAGTLALPLAPDRAVALICAADIAAMAALALAESARTRGARIDIAGCAITPAATAAAFGRVLGHEVVFESVPAAVARRYGDDLAAMFAYFDTVGLDVDTDALRARFPEVGWHTFDDWLASRDWSAARARPAARA